MPKSSHNQTPIRQNQYSFYTYTPYQANHNRNKTRSFTQNQSNYQFHFVNFNQTSSAFNKNYNKVSERWNILSPDDIYRSKQNAFALALDDMVHYWRQEGDFKSYEYMGMKRKKKCRYINGKAKPKVEDVILVHYQENGTSIKDDLSHYLITVGFYRNQYKSIAQSVKSDLKRQGFNLKQRNTEQKIAIDENELIHEHLAFNPHQCYIKLQFDIHNFKHWQIMNGLVQSIMSHSDLDDALAQSIFDKLCNENPQKFNNFVQHLSKTQNRDQPQPSVMGETESQLGYNYANSARTLGQKHHQMPAAHSYQQNTYCTYYGQQPASAASSSTTSSAQIEMLKYNTPQYLLPPVHTFWHVENQSGQTRALSELYLYGNNDHAHPAKTRETGSNHDNVNNPAFNFNLEP